MAKLYIGGKKLKFILQKINEYDDLCNIFEQLSDDFFISIEQRKEDKGKYVRKLITFGEVHAAYADNRELAGLMCFYCNNHQRKEGYLAIIVIKTEYRRKGLATFMLNELEMFCRKQNMETIRLEVNRKNIAAMELYRKQGYSFQKEVKSDTIYMRKELLNKEVKE